MPCHVFSTKSLDVPDSAVLRLSPEIKRQEIWELVLAEFGNCGKLPCDQPATHGGIYVATTGSKNNRNHQTRGEPFVKGVRASFGLNSKSKTKIAVGDVFGDVGFSLLFLDLPLSELRKYAGIFAVKSDRKKG